MIKPITQIPHHEDFRYSSGIAGFDKFLGGGYVDGQCILFAGEPGVGKSTLLTQLCFLFAKTGQKVLYISGEESLSQIRLRADRLKAIHPYFYCSDNRGIEEIIAEADNTLPKLMIVDSLQMVRSSDIKQEPGNSKQMKYSLDKLITYAKSKSLILIVIGHSTKSGLIAGLQTLQHMVDAVFLMTKGDPDTQRITLTSKNRFGSTQTSWTAYMTPLGIAEEQASGSKNLLWPYPGIEGLILNPIYWILMLVSFPLVLIRKS